MKGICFGQKKKMEPFGGFKKIPLYGNVYEWHADIFYSPTRIRFANGKTWRCSSDRDLNKESMLNALNSVQIIYVANDSLNIRFDFRDDTLPFELEFNERKLIATKGQNDRQLALLTNTATDTITSKLHNLDTRLEKLLLATAAAAPL